MSGAINKTTGRGEGNPGPDGANNANHTDTIAANNRVVPGPPMLHGPPVPQSSGQGSECLQGPWDPKGGELYRSTMKPWETVVEVGRCSDVQIV